MTIDDACPGCGTRGDLHRGRSRADDGQHCSIVVCTHCGHTATLAPGGELTPAGPAALAIGRAVAHALHLPQEQPWPSPTSAPAAIPPSTR